MDVLTTLQALYPKAATAVLTALIDVAEADFKAECHRDDVPEGAASVILRMVQHKWGQLDGAGLASQSYSGASESFLTDWPEDLKRAMHRFRRAVLM